MMARGRSVRRQKLRTAAKAATEAMGCTCDAHYRVGSGRGIEGVKVAHDEWCPMGNAPCTVILFNPSDFPGCAR